MTIPHSSSIEGNVSGLGHCLGSSEWCAWSWNDYFPNKNISTPIRIKTAMEALHCNHPATKQLANDHPEGLCHVEHSILFFAPGRLGIQVAIAMAGHRIAGSPTDTNTTLP